MTLVRWQKEILIFLILFFGMSLFSFWLLNGGAYAKNLRYSLFLNSPLAAADLKTGQLLEIKKADGATIPQQTPTTTSINQGFTLLIPKIGVSAPIVLNPEDDMKSILASLEDGVGLYPGSELPGKPGRAVVLGHSSRASWYRGEYATVFALLPKLEVKDTFYVYEGQKRYTYEVIDKKVLSPQDTTTFLSTNTPDSEVDLITCYPIGSASKRTIIQGKLVKTE